MDGFLSGAQGNRRPGPALGGFSSSSGRRIGDFKRAEGYHPAPQAVISSEKLTHQSLLKAENLSEPQPASILHMTLPGGYADKNRQPGQTKGRRRWRRLRKWGLRSTLVLAPLFLIAGASLGWYVYSQIHKVFKGGGTAAALQADVRPELLKGEGDGLINILILGKGGENHEGPDLTDTILIASIDPINKIAHLVSLPRDLWVTTPQGSSKINAVYANAKYRSLAQDSKDKVKAETAGVKAIDDAVTQVLGIPLHYYATVDFNAFQEAVDTVGGVTVDVPEDLVDYTMAWQNGGNPKLAKKGLQTFNGKQALMYVRSRHGSARGDFDRTDRQRRFITALSQKVLSAGTYSNPVKLTQLMSTFGNHVSTDFSIKDMLRLMSIAKGIGNNIKSIGLADPPNNFVRTDSMNNQSVVRPTAGFGDYTAIQNYIRNTLRDPYIAKENAEVMILNGTPTAGLAGVKQAELMSYGYNVLSIGDAPTDTYTKTVLVDTSAGKNPYTKNYLEKRLGVKAVSKLPDANIQATGADFVIILGQP